MKKNTIKTYLTLALAATDCATEVSALGDKIAPFKLKRKTKTDEYLRSKRKAKSKRRRRKKLIKRRK